MNAERSGKCHLEIVVVGRWGNRLGQVHRWQFQFSHRRRGLCGSLQVPDLGIYPLLVALALFDDMHTLQASSNLDGLACTAFGEKLQLQCNLKGRATPN